MTPDEKTRTALIEHLVRFLPAKPWEEWEQEMREHNLTEDYIINSRLVRVEADVRLDEALSVMKVIFGEEVRDQLHEDAIKRLQWLREHD